LQTIILILLVANAIRSPCSGLKADYRPLVCFYWAAVLELEYGICSYTINILMAKRIRSPCGGLKADYRPLVCFYWAAVLEYGICNYTINILMAKTIRTMLIVLLWPREDDNAVGHAGRYF
jgi:hypothetical protein